MTPQQFVEKWRPVTLTERAAAQSHFRDLCELFDHPDPPKADPHGEWFAYEKGVVTASGGDGFADVWMRDHFAWEYKKRKRNLDEALGQLARYALALENPPLHIACDTDRVRIVTAWTNTVPRSYELTLDDLLIPEKRDILRSVFYHPDSLKPNGTRAALTEDAANKFSEISARLLSRGVHSVEEVGHFVNRLVFLYFAEDVRILPGNYFRRVLAELAARPSETANLLGGLFATLKGGGRFGLDRLPHVNGGLFDDRPALPLDDGDIRLLIAAGSESWAHIDPTIFGTLFERLLDPTKRSQIGAHYTDPAKISMLIEPVILKPLRDEWAAARDAIEKLVKTARQKGSRAKEWAAAEEKRSQFIESLRCMSVLDPACGSGNFLYLALAGIKNIEHAANQECEGLGLPPRLPTVGPEILHGIEVNPLAAELARTTIWIGDIQWAIQNGIYTRPEPVLRPLDSIECRDAILSYTPAGAREPSWPRADYIVGNPPFLGGKKLRDKLGDKYVEDMFSVYRDRVPAEADLVTYWFERARECIASGDTVRAGLVTTQAIRGGANRQLLSRVAADAPIFEAWSDEPWVLDGAAVRVSLLCFGSRPRGKNSVTLDGVSVDRINLNLTATEADLTKAQVLDTNKALMSQGIKFGGPFALSQEVASQMISLPSNVNGLPNEFVIRRWTNGDALLDGRSALWCLDFGLMSEPEAKRFEKPYAVLRRHFAEENARRVSENERPLRANEPRSARLWWIHQRRRDRLLRRISGLSRYIAKLEVAKHPVFCFVDARIVPSGSVYVIARDDYLSFGVLHSIHHQVWGLRLGTALENRPRYTPTTTFETFPFPPGLVFDTGASQSASDPRAVRIEQAARDLDALRNRWLNPPELIRVRQSPTYPDIIEPRDAPAAQALRGRTLTELYNDPPHWLRDAHSSLDRAVAAAYGWPEDIDEDDALTRLLDLNLARAAEQDAARAASSVRRRSRAAN